MAPFTFRKYLNFARRAPKKKEAKMKVVRRRSNVGVGGSFKCSKVSSLSIQNPKSFSLRKFCVNPYRLNK